MLNYMGTMTKGRIALLDADEILTDLFDDGVVSRSKAKENDITADPDKLDPEPDPDEDEKEEENEAEVEVGEV